MTAPNQEELSMSDDLQHEEHEMTEEQVETILRMLTEVVESQHETLKQHQVLLEQHHKMLTDKPRRSRYSLLKW